MGSLVTLSLPPDSPVAALPWVITISPLDDAEGWEPVVFGPYERDHALALAQAVVAVDDLVAVVEPLLRRIDAEAIRDEIEAVRAAGAGPAEDDDPPDYVETVQPGPVPTAAEVREGLARLASRLVSE